MRIKDAAKDNYEENLIILNLVGCLVCTARLAVCRLENELKVGNFISPTLYRMSMSLLFHRVLAGLRVRREPFFAAAHLTSKYSQFFVVVY